MTDETLVGDLYRGILQRNPDPVGLRNHTAALTHGKTLTQLVRGFIESAEFAEAFQPGSSRDIPVRVDLDAPMDIDLTATPTQTAALWAGIAATWDHLGQTDPYWSVLSNPRFRLAHMDTQAALDAFFASGQSDLARIEAWLNRHGRALHPGLVCAEFGCGVGRVTPWLAERCTTRGLDISAPHLALARARLDHQGHTDVALTQVSGAHDTLHALQRVDLFLSTMVLQHNPPPLMMSILDAAFAGLNPGGLALFQLPTFSRGYRFATAAHLARTPPDETATDLHCLPQQWVFERAAFHGLTPLEVQQDGLIGRWGASHTFLFAKPARPARPPVTLRAPRQAARSAKA